MIANLSIYNSSVILKILVIIREKFRPAWVGRCPLIPSKDNVDRESYYGHKDSISNTDPCYKMPLPF